MRLLLTLRTHMLQSSTCPLLWLEPELEGEGKQSK